MKNNLTIKLILLLVIPMVFYNCTSKKSNQVTNKEDYKAYLEVNDNKILQDINKEIEFWQTKYNAAPNQSSYLITLASQYSQLFEIKGKIGDLYKAEKLLLEANKKFVEQNAGIHRAIARNYISQHRFKEALSHLEKAQKLGENKMGTNKMLFDVYMELGSYDLAKEKLTAIQMTDDFDYLIRLAKWNDHKGDLDTAISCMEKALKIAEDENNKGLKLWVYSNIGDFYGHAGRIEDSYKYYLKTLEVDNHNTYALKGIAWISFSHERNPEQALEIINTIESKHLVPDLYLLKAEIAAFQNNKAEEEKEIKTYTEILALNDYGDMYNKYNVLLMAENPDQVDAAIKIAKKEIKNRPTPESYDLLAWSFFKIGEKEKALEVIQKYTIGKSFEPNILYHNAEILKANNQTDEIAPMKKELLASIYELGPSLESKIKNL
ncbi:MAG: tetratricopeptide (TPR) repeat protein [Flavobacterium sp.]|jgi:tetratricopeptide (TPR) repeat protein